MMEQATELSVHVALATLSVVESLDCSKSPIKYVEKCSQFFIAFFDIFTGTFFNVLCTQQYRIQDTNRKKNQPISIRNPNQQKNIVKINEHRSK